MLSVCSGWSCVFVFVLVFVVVFFEDLLWFFPFLRVLLFISCGIFSGCAFLVLFVIYIMGFWVFYFVGFFINRVSKYVAGGEER